MRKVKVHLGIRRETRKVSTGISAAKGRVGKICAHCRLDQRSGDRKYGKG